MLDFDNKLSTIRKSLSTFMNKLPLAKRAQIIGLLDEGTSLRATSRLAAQLIAIGNAVAAHKDISIDIFLTGDASDMPALAQILSEELQKSANWRPMTWTWTWTWSGIPPFKGSVILVKESAGAINTAAASALSDVQSGTDIASPMQAWPGRWDKFGGLLKGPPFLATRKFV
jgi:hypothetical protein